NKLQQFIMMQHLNRRYWMLFIQQVAQFTPESLAGKFFGHAAFDGPLQEPVRIRADLEIETIRKPDRAQCPRWIINETQAVQHAHHALVDVIPSAKIIQQRSEISW